MNRYRYDHYYFPLIMFSGALIWSIYKALTNPEPSGWWAFSATCGFNVVTWTYLIIKERNRGR